jgi:isoleucyl-tRNA synthetase
MYMSQKPQEHEKTESVSFKDTLNLPRTDFPIRPNAGIDDPTMIARWQDQDLYTKSFVHNKGNEQFILHDGPPYANGPIHLGHAYNKMLKDILAKFHRMSGKHVPVTPGWDCHGLPIELNVTREYPGLSGQALKKECRAYAQKWIDVQREDFKRLGVLMDWEHPYRTMDYSYEASIIRAFGVFVTKGYIAKKNKTVPWCSSCQTVLASAEIEYKDKKDPSIYVTFALTQESQSKLVHSLKGKKVSLLIWTTTPWTLPLNRAVLLKSDTQYAVFSVHDAYIIVAQALVEKVAAMLGVAGEVVATFNANDADGLYVQHPFIDSLQVPIILDQSVSLQDGTAVVHCAPGCGPDDYEIGIKQGLQIYSPIKENGTYTIGIEPKILQNMTIADGQSWVLKTLLANGSLLHKASITHSYPHCWRCHNSLIFRATQQWFCGLEHGNLRQRALEAIEKITFLPPKSRNYLKATVEGRLEWCLSRQRQWGVPIPALLCSRCKYPYCSPELIEKVAQGVAQHGIEYWDDVTLEQLGFNDVACQQCAHTEFVKETDILDVWFDSGVSHYAVLFDNPALGFPADAYIEGIDQHRGWFQSSLLTSLVLESESCTRMFLTHGFTVDDKGHKMSKSLGNVVSPHDLIAKLGTDGLRLWVASIDYSGDAIVSQALLTNVAEVYRKIRNTCRFLISNLYDFDHAKDGIAIDSMSLIDRYALEKLFQLNTKIRAAYAQSDFTAVSHALADYCTKELSSLYLDIIKDRLYVEKHNGVERRSAQTVCWYILDTLTKLIAPILSFTAEQLSDHYQLPKLTSVHLQTFNDLPDVWRYIAWKNREELPALDWYPYRGHIQETVDAIDRMNFIAERTQQWKLLFSIRDAVLKAIEQQRELGLIKHSLEARVTLQISLAKQQQDVVEDFYRDIGRNGQSVEQFFKEFFIVSQCSLVADSKTLPQSIIKDVLVLVEHAHGVKCPRCWQWDTTNHIHELCNRCQKVLSV